MKYTSETKEAIELLKTLISIPSTSRNEKDAADEMGIFIQKCGFPYHRKGNNIWIADPEYDPLQKTILLNAHIDTVKPSGAWTRNPFCPETDNGRLYGLGSNDCGGGLVALLQSFRIITGQGKRHCMRNKPRNYNLVYLASCEEEISGKGGFSLVRPELPHIDAAIVGEPTGMQPAIAEKGLVVIDGTAHGITGHAARNEGENAIYKVLDDILWLRSYKFKKTSPLLGATKMSVTIINAGSQHNVIPDECTFTIDVRTNELYTNEEVFEIIKKNVKSEVKARSFRLNSSRIDMSHPIVKQCTGMGMKPFGSPTLSDQALMPWDSLKLGPGESSRSHSADEYILLGEIEDAIDKYVSILCGLDF